MSQGRLGLPDEAFHWGPLHRPVADAAAAAVVQAGQANETGVWLDGPQTCPIERLDGLTLAGVRGGSLPELQAWDVVQGGLLVAQRARDLRAMVGRLHTIEPPPGLGRATSGLAQAASWEPLMAEPTASCPEVPRRQADWWFTVLDGPRASNAVRTRLEIQPITDSAVAAYIEAQRQPSYPRAIWPAVVPKDELPRYEVTPHSPPLPESPGIDAFIQPARGARGKRQRIIRASFLVPVPADCQVRPRPADPGNWVQINDPNASAVVPMQIVVRGQQVVGPWLWTIQVPVYDPQTPGIDGQSLGFCHVDILALPDAPTVSQRYVAHLLCGPVASQGIAFTLDRG